MSCNSIGFDEEIMSKKCVLYTCLSGALIAKKVQTLYSCHISNMTSDQGLHCLLFKNVVYRISFFLETYYILKPPTIYSITYFGLHRLKCFKIGNRTATLMNTILLLYELFQTMNVMITLPTKYAKTMNVSYVIFF